jgi:hypothetical protein
MARWSGDDDAYDTRPSGLFGAAQGEYSGFIAARALLLALLAVWGLRIARLSVSEGEMSGSFMHPILLPFHEAGHVVFMPFGDFMMAAGGTIGQLAVPLIVMVAFRRTNRDNFAAAIALWWFAMSLIDVAPYAWDALEPKLMLLSGQTGETGGHDWIAMLGHLGWLRHAHGVGRFFHVSGVFVMLLALLWGTVVLARTWAQRER